MHWSPGWSRRVRALPLVATVMVLAACSNPFFADADRRAPGSLVEPPSRAQQLHGASDLPAIPAHLVNETMYQFFYWDAYPGLWADLSKPGSPLHAMAQRLAHVGVTSAWLPPAAKGMGGTSSVGYDPYDFWDLGEFDQKGTIPTRYGTRAELGGAVSNLKGMGIDAYFDVVFNHRMGADAEEDVPGHGLEWSYFDPAGRDAYYTSARWGALHHDFVWNWEAFDGESGELFPGKSWDDTYHYPYLMGLDVDHGRPDVRAEMQAWGEWIVEEIGFAGFRMDAVAHVDSDFTRAWVDHVQAATDTDVFFVGEAWVGDVGGFLDRVGTPHLRAFDFALRDDFVALSGGSKDMRWWGGITNSAYADRAVTFVDNHDTSREGNPYGTPQVHHFKNQAYAYILMREHGVPTVFARDYDEFGMAPTLDRLIEARRYFAYGRGHEQAVNTPEVYAYVREGLADVPGTGLVMLISGRSSGGRQELWIDSHQPNTAFYDYTGNVDGTITTDAGGYASFPVNLAEGTGWSVWVPVPEPRTVTLRMTVSVGWGKAVYFTGSTGALTSWGGGVKGTWTDGDVWEVTIDDPGEFEWKTRCGPYDGTGEAWEQGSNHTHANLHPSHQGWGSAC